MLVTNEIIDLDELERQAVIHKMEKEISVKIKDLGDISGHTLVVTLPGRVSMQQVERLHRRLKDQLPEDATVLVMTGDGVTVAVEKPAPQSVADPFGLEP